MARGVVIKCARVLGRQLAELGFEPDRFVFRRYNHAGDAVIVDLQSYAAFFGETRFFVNLAFVLAPEWEWARRRLGYPATKRPETMHGGWWARINPVDWTEETAASGEYSDTWVIAEDSPAAIEATAARVFARLQESLPDLLRWLDREHLEEAAAHDYATWRFQAWALAEVGTVDELELFLADDDSPDEELNQALRAHAEIKAGGPSGGSRSP
jgi:hypothetical protein